MFKITLAGGAVVECNSFQEAKEFVSMGRGSEELDKKEYNRVYAMGYQAGIKRAKTTIQDASEIEIRQL